MFDFSPCALSIFESLSAIQLGCAPHDGTELIRFSLHFVWNKILIRRKLPGDAVQVEVKTGAFSSVCLEMHRDAIPAGSNVLIVDDVIGSGATLGAAILLASSWWLRIRGGAIANFNCRTKWSHRSRVLCGCCSERCETFCTSASRTSLLFNRGKQTIGYFSRIQKRIVNA